MIEFVHSNLPAVWLIIGFTLLAVEILAFGMASGVLLFCGAGAILTGILLWMGIVPAGWLVSIATFTVLSAMVAAVLWRPLKKMQGGQVLGNDKSSDLIGHEFRLDQEVSVTNPGTTRFSGIDWRVELDDSAGVTVNLQKGSKVRVTRVDSGVFYVAGA